MATTHFLLALTTGALLLSWLGLGAYAVGGRAAYDLRARRLASARTLGSGRGLSRRDLRRATGDVSLPPEVLQRFAFEAGAGTDRRRLLRRAGSHRTELGKWRRIEALRILALVDERAALPLLERALRADEDVAAAAAVTIRGVGSAAGAAVLAGAIGDSSLPDARLGAELDAYPLDIPQVVLALAGDASPTRRYRGLGLLSRYGHREDVRERLLGAAADPDPDVRAAAAEALGAAADGGLAELRMLVRDPIWFVRAHAARALGARGATELGADVAPLLADESWWVRAAAKEALTSLGTEAELALAPYLTHADPFARNGAVEILERVGVVDTVLAAAVRSPYDLRKRRYALAIVRASGGALEAAVERAAPDLRESLLTLVEDVERAA